MRTTTAHTLPARYAGERNVTVTLTFDAIRNAAGSLPAVLGASVAYRVSAGDGTIAGDDVCWPPGFRSTSDDLLLRLLLIFLAAEHAHAMYCGDYAPCAEYGDGCPAGRSGYLTDLDRMIDAIEDGSWISER